MYCSHFKFSEKPFDVTPDPRFLYLTPDHREALAAIIYGIRERRGIITIIGSAGVGKTTVLNATMNRLDNKIKVAFIRNPIVTFNELFTTALQEWGLAKPNEKISKINALQRLNHFAAEQTAMGHYVVLIVDEAQSLDSSVIESLRLLSNLESQKHKLIQIVFSGQPEFEFTLSRFKMHQFTQRINLRRFIPPLNKNETYSYVKHRLNISNYKGPKLFSQKSMALIWDYSQGIPRKINILCDNALLIAYAIQKKTISTDMVEKAINDLDPAFFSKSGKQKTNSHHYQLIMVISVVITTCLIFSLGFYLGNDQLKLRNNSSSRAVRDADVKISNNKSVYMSPMNRRTTDSTVSDDEPVDVPKRQIDLQVKMATEQLNESHLNNEISIVQGETLEGITEIVNIPEEDKIDSAPISQDIIYRVQIISSGTRLTKNFPQFNGLKNIWEYKHGNRYNYTIGSVKDLKSAIVLQSELREKGFGGAFVVTFQNGKRKQ